MKRPGRLRRMILIVVVAAAAVLAAAAYIWRADIRTTFLDPGFPFQTYKPPPAPDYRQRGAWALLPAQPASPTANEPPADVFFIHPTTFDGGRDWSGRIDDPTANRLLMRTMLPNYAGPFRDVGRIFAPRYRQASLYTLLTSRDDAREARAFAYGDIARAFEAYMAQYNDGRPLIIVGVEQGGLLAERLLIEMSPEQRSRLIAAYLIETAAPADAPPLAPCASRDQAHCLVAWISRVEGEPDTLQDRLRHSLVWSGERLKPLGQRTPVCVNPVSGQAGGSAGAKAHRGGVNASKLDLDARPAFLAHQVSTACEDGVLEVSRARSASLRAGSSWGERERAKPFNLFYADLEADAQARTAAYTAELGAHR